MIIKFRMWDEICEQYLQLDPSNLRSMATASGSSIFVAPHQVLEQFTGLLDRNGREIYEGDVAICDLGTAVNPDRYNGSVEPMHGGAFWFSGKPMDHKIGDKTSFPMLQTIGSQYEVIGNIHEGEQ